MATPADVTHEVRWCDGQRILLRYCVLLELPHVRVLAAPVLIRRLRLVVLQQLADCHLAMGEAVQFGRIR